ncbi:MAG TPA: SPOR domain-containing protein [Halanaerobiales bacterium]|nr:SPOR domain-containing protein [Halanaerobiales bacterium]
MAKKKKSNRSLTLVIIVMAIICVFVGYLVGLNLFRWMKGGTDQAAQTENNTQEQVQQQEDTNDISQSIEESETESEQTQTAVEENTTETQETNQVTSPEENQNVFKIQVGAFSQKANAESFKKELEDKGYDVIIKEASTFKVRVLGKQTREETEKIEEQLIELGYDTFIVK